MELAVRPHRGGTVLGLGILGLMSALFFLPLGILAWVMGSKDLKAMDGGRVDSSGRSLTQVGRVFGIAATLMWIGWTPLVVLTFCVPGFTTVHESFGRLYDDGSRDTKTSYPRVASDSGSSVVEWEYREVPGPNGSLVKEGPAVHWSREHKKLEEGSYHDGKRDGEWTFWNEDGSIDPSRSGRYENDIRVQPGATPPGDYQPRPVPAGYKERR